MNVQACAPNGIDLVDLPSDPQADMISRQRRFQARVYGEAKLAELRDFGSSRRCDVRAVLHHLDMGGQECSEAWDMVEGGWKHHKTNPHDPDKLELMMELVDIMCFALNTYIYMGGQPESELVAAAVARSKEQMRYPKIGLDEAWVIGASSWERNGPKMRALYDHGRGSHGREWTKEAATRINFLRAQFFDSAATIRYGLSRMTKAERETFPPASGYVYIQLVPWICGAVQAIPGMGLQDLYSAFVKKDQINNERQDAGY